jgi:VanZ like protein/concanavalin A-like lectin/glucanase superfamily protein
VPLFRQLPFYVRLGFVTGSTRDVLWITFFKDKLCRRSWRGSVSAVTSFNARVPTDALSRNAATVLLIFCACILFGMLIVGLWPFHKPSNNVRWITNQDGLILGHHGTLLSSDTFDFSGSEAQAPCSLESWFQPYDLADGGTVFAFYSSDNLLGFSLRQDGTHLVLKTERRDAKGRTIDSGISIHNVFRQHTPAFVTVSSGPSGAEVYVDGSLIRTIPWFRITSINLTGHLVVGTSPVKNDAWTGKLRGLAIYRRALTRAEALQHYRAWETIGRPYSAENERGVALYLFDEHSGRVVHNRGSVKVDLYIPEKFTVLNEKFLEPAWNEFNLRWSYWKSALINIGGFVPLGFFCCAYLSLTKPMSRAAVVTVVLGFTVSLTIEVFQSFLPTRDSGTTDLITNTLGTGLGVMVYGWKPSLLTGILSRIPFST